MKVSITYNLPEEQEEYDRANKATDLCSFVWDFQQYLRDQWKYAEKPDEIDKIYEKWFEMKNDNGIDLEKIYP